MDKCDRARPCTYHEFARVKEGAIVDGFGILDDPPIWGSELSMPRFLLLCSVLFVVFRRAVEENP